MTTTVTVDWYFDYISPFAYLQSQQLGQLPDHVQIRYRPILFSGLLNHWGQLGPVEIERKRDFTYQQVLWLARRHNIRFTFPPAHPFNPLPALRLTLAQDSDPSLVHHLFRKIWAEGRDLSSPDDWRSITDELSLPDADEMIKQPEIKQQLHDSTQHAISEGVFGVPTFCADAELFWGFDSIEMFKDYLSDQTFFADPERVRLRVLPSSASRL